MATRILDRLISASRVSAAADDSAALSIEELESGLRKFDRGDIGPAAFWDENVESFRQTALVAMRETSEALLWLPMPEDARAELERQLPELRNYIRLADDYMARRSGNLPESRLIN